MKKQTVTLKPKEGQQDRLPGLTRSREKDIRPSHLNGFTEQPLLGFKETMLISISKTPVQAVKRKGLQKDTRVVYDWLQQQDFVLKKIGSLGLFMGGRVSLIPACRIRPLEQMSYFFTR